MGVCVCQRYVCMEGAGVCQRYVCTLVVTWCHTVLEDPGYALLVCGIGWGGAKVLEDHAQQLHQRAERQHVTVGAAANKNEEEEENTTALDRKKTRRRRDVKTRDTVILLSGL